MKLFQGWHNYPRPRLSASLSSYTYRFRSLKRGSVKRVRGRLCWLAVGGCWGVVGLGWNPRVGGRQFCTELHLPCRAAPALRKAAQRGWHQRDDISETIEGQPLLSHPDRVVAPVRHHVLARPRPHHAPGLFKRVALPRPSTNPGPAIPVGCLYSLPHACLESCWFPCKRS
jgi:hypothetical protein